jgi:hypothetical protein
MTSFSVRGPSARGAYDAIVQLDPGGYVWAEDAEGQSITPTGEAGVDDLEISDYVISKIPIAGNHHIIFRGDFNFPSSLNIIYPYGCRTLRISGDALFTFASGGLMLKVLENRSYDSRLTLENLELIGPGYAAGGAGLSVHANSLGLSGRLILSKIKSTGFQYGFNLSGADLLVPYNASLEFLETYYCNKGIVLGGGHNVLHASESYAPVGVNSIGIELTHNSSSGGNLLLSCDGGSNDVGFYLNASNGNHLVNPYHEGIAGTTFIKVEGDGNRIVAPIGPRKIDVAMAGTSDLINNVIVLQSSGISPEIRIGARAYGTCIDLNAMYDTPNISQNLGHNGRIIQAKSGTSTGTTTEQTIAHGVIGTPSIKITFLEAGGILTDAWADSENIHVTANAKAYKWTAEVA